VGTDLVGVCAGEHRCFEIAMSERRRPILFELLSPTQAAARCDVSLDTFMKRVPKRLLRDKLGDQKISSLDLADWWGQRMLSPKSLTRSQGAAMTQAHFKNVNRAPGRRGQKVYFYHRITGSRLPDDYGSPAFAAAWAIEEARGLPKIEGPERESYAALVEAFRKPENKIWPGLSDHTRKDYDEAITWFGKRTSKTGERFDRLPAAKLTQGSAEELVDAAAAEHGYRFGGKVLAFHRRLWNWVLEKQERQKLWGDKNPWENIKAPERPKGLKKRHRTWEYEEFVTVLLCAVAADQLGLARSYVLGISGCAGGDIVNRLWTEYDGEQFSAMDREKTGVTGYPAIPEALRYFLDEGGKPCAHVASNGHGEAWASANALQTASSDFLRKLAKEGAVGEGLTLHGLRHTLGKLAAEREASEYTIQALLQHKDPRMARHYSKEASRKRLAKAGMDAIGGWFDPNLPNVIPISCKTSRKRA
jgi:integrase